MLKWGGLGNTLCNTQVCINIRVSSGQYNVLLKMLSHSYWMAGVLPDVFCSEKHPKSGIWQLSSTSEIVFPQVMALASMGVSAEGRMWQSNFQIQATFRVKTLGDLSLQLRIVIERKCSLEIWHFQGWLWSPDSRSWVNFCFSFTKYLFMKWQNNVNRHCQEEKRYGWCVCFIQGHLGLHTQISLPKKSLQ